MFNKQELHRWFADDGDNTHILNHYLNADSIVIDIGAYKGVWAEKIIRIYNPCMILFEPLKQFMNDLYQVSLHSQTVLIVNNGIHPISGLKKMKLSADGSHIADSGYPCSFIKPETIFQIIDREEIDLVQINIEGSEYDLLENMIETGLIKHFLTIQVQFHNIAPDCPQRRNDIRSSLQQLGYREKYCYEFVWECWTKI